MYFDQFKYPFIPEIRVNIHIVIGVRLEWVGKNSLIQRIKTTIAVAKVSRWWIF